MSSAFDRYLSDAVLAVMLAALPLSAFLFVATTALKICSAVRSMFPIRE